MTMIISFVCLVRQIMKCLDERKQYSVVAQNNYDTEPPSATNADDLYSPGNARGRSKVVYVDEQKYGAKSSVASDVGLLRAPETERATPGGPNPRTATRTN